MRPRQFIFVSSLCVITTTLNASPQSDSYISGYAAGLLKHELKRELPTLSVSDGVISLPSAGMNAAEQNLAVELLSDIPGVTAVKMSTLNDVTPPTAEIKPNQMHEAAASKGLATTTLPTGMLPKGHLFKPLLADPRWAHFSAAYRNYLSNNYDGKNIASVSFGETIPFYRANFGHTQAQWELGLQAGVFSDFSLDASSTDLLNTDFIASIYSSIRVQQFSVFARLFHQSSHLGDEFLLSQLNSNFQRINLSYEGIDLKLSYELPYGVRLYGGGSGLFHKEPSNLNIWATQAGIEFRSPWLLDFAGLRPVIAADIKNHEENNWNADISARAGVEFDNLQVLGRKLQILAEYYNGYSPSGQFYKDKVQYIGIGAHYHF